MTRKRYNFRKSAGTVIPSVKHSNVKMRVQQLIHDEKYVATGHAKKRLDHREVTMKEVRSVLVGGAHVTEDDEFCEFDAAGNKILRWSYAFVKQGLDRKLKVCVAIDDTKSKPLLIVTVIDLG